MIVASAGMDVRGDSERSENLKIKTERVSPSKTMGKTGLLLLLLLLLRVEVRFGILCDRGNSKLHL